MPWHQRIDDIAHGAHHRSNDIMRTNNAPRRAALFSRARIIDGAKKAGHQPSITRSDGAHRMRLRAHRRFSNK